MFTVIVRTGMLLSLPSEQRLEVANLLMKICSFLTGGWGARCNCANTPGWLSQRDAL